MSTPAHLRFGIRLLMAACVVTLSGCFATPRLWEATDPNEFVLVLASETTEEHLKQAGVRFIPLKDGHGFLVEKTTWNKAGNYAVRILAIPVTVVLDTAVIVIIGASYVALSSPLLVAEIACSR